MKLSGERKPFVPLPLQLEHVPHSFQQTTALHAHNTLRHVLRHAQHTRMPTNTHTHTHTQHNERCTMVCVPSVSGVDLWKLQSHFPTHPTWDRMCQERQWDKLCVFSSEVLLN